MSSPRKKHTITIKEIVRSNSECGDNDKIIKSHLQEEDTQQLLSLTDSTAENELWKMEFPSTASRNSHWQEEVALDIGSSSSSSSHSDGESSTESSNTIVSPTTCARMPDNAKVIEQNDNWEVQMLAEELDKIEREKENQEIQLLENEIQELKKVVRQTDLDNLSKSELDILEKLLQVEGKKVRAVAKTLSLDEGQHPDMATERRRKFQQTRSKPVCAFSSFDSIGTRFRSGFSSQHELRENILRNKIHHLGKRIQTSELKLAKMHLCKKQSKSQLIKQQSLCDQSLDLNQQRCARNRQLTRAGPIRSGSVKSVFQLDDKPSTIIKDVSSSSFLSWFQRKQATGKEFLSAGSLEEPNASSSSRVVKRRSSSIGSLPRTLLPGFSSLSHSIRSGLRNHNSSSSESEKPVATISEGCNISQTSSIIKSQTSLDNDTNI